MMCLLPFGLAFERSVSLPVSAATWLEKGESTFFIRSARRGLTLINREAPKLMNVLIGIDPHKGSHTAVAIDGNETLLAQLKVRATKTQCDQLLKWAAQFDQRRWAIEAAAGLGYLLAQQLVTAGEDVVDVPPTLSARVRVLGSGKSDKNDPNDALSTAVAALRGRRLRTVLPDDFATILRMLADRHQDLTSLRTQAVCRLHAKLADLIPGGLSGRLAATRAQDLLTSIDASDGIIAERKQQATDLCCDVRRLDSELAALKARLSVAVTAANTSLTDIHGVGPVVAALIIGHSGDIGRFASRNHYASYNGSAPIEASSGPKRRHRLNTRGNRQLNHALHVIAVTQTGHDTVGRDYYRRKLDEGKTKKEAIRALKRRISDAVYRHLIIDAR